MKTLKLPVLAIAAVTMLMLLSACATGNGNDAPGNGAPGKYDNFAKCLANNGVKMYGAYWCSHCKNQKELFGASFQLIDYVECDPRGKNPKSELCAQVGIKGYPTWQINGQPYSGEQSFEKLSALSGCQIEGGSNGTNN